MNLQHAIPSDSVRQNVYAAATMFREALNYFEVIGIVLAVTSLVLLMRFA